VKQPGIGNILLMGQAAAKEAEAKRSHPFRLQPRTPACRVSGRE
jgi:hypothetical protein